MSGSLILVGTPIGNLGDISKRAIDALKSADFIAAEDTRVTIKLLNHLNIKKPMISYFEHNKHEKGDIICNRIEQGEICVLVSDAGMPAISDPGEELVQQCIERNIKVSVIPGPSAFISALAISGLATGRFTFEGFLSMNKKNRKQHLESLKTEPRTMIFYEAPHKLLYTLKDMLSCFGERNISIVRELTKIHEEVIRLNFSNAIELFETQKIRGEIVLIIEGYHDIKSNDPEIDINKAIKIAYSLENEGMSRSEACREAAKISGIKKGDIYKKLCEL